MTTPAMTLEERVREACGAAYHDKRALGFNYCRCPEIRALLAEVLAEQAQEGKPK